MTSNLYIQVSNKGGMKSLKKLAFFFLFISSLLLIDMSVSHADVVGQISKLSTITNEIEIGGVAYKLPSHVINAQLKVGDFVSFNAKDEVIQYIKALGRQIDTLKSL